MNLQMFLLLYFIADFKKVHEYRLFALALSQGFLIEYFEVAHFSVCNAEKGPGDKAWVFNEHTCTLSKYLCPTLGL